MSLTRRPNSLLEARDSGLLIFKEIKSPDETGTALSNKGPNIVTNWSVKQESSLVVVQQHNFLGIIRSHIIFIHQNNKSSQKGAFVATNFTKI